MATSDNSKKPFELTVTGQAEIPHLAERAIINLSVQSSGPDKAQVSSQVLSTTHQIEALLRDLSPQNSSSAAKESSPLAHWSKTSLSSTSHQPQDYNNPERILPRQYTSTIRFDVRFRDFNALGGFGTKLSPLPHVEVANIDWVLTTETEKSFRSRLRREAARDALLKAQDYCAVLGSVNVRPVELQEGDAVRAMGGLGESGARYRSMQTARVAARRFGGPGEEGQDERAEDLSFDAQEVKMSTEVTVKFHAD